jgi:poly-gamma-glutamate synthesis protein (capsule biosynthesis protein)
VLDFSYEGMYDTMSSLDRVQIKWAGVGKNLTEAQKPAIITFHGGIKIACFSFADHYNYWASSALQAGINYINPNNIPPDFFESLKTKIVELRRNENIQLVSISIHWGSNYAWEPPAEFNTMAHQLIDICGVDLIHGHSSHHVQGIEIYKNKVIIYGCGDFVDDYAVDDEYRNDLSFLYRLYLDTETYRWKRLELLPTRIKHFQVNRALGDDKTWLTKTIRKLSNKYLTNIQIDNSNDTLYIDI